MNYNPIISSNFKLIIPGLEEVNYFIQRCPLPGMNQSAVNSYIANNPVKSPGETIHYNPLSVDIIIDEDLTNLLLLQAWMIDNYSKEGIYQRCRDIQLHITTRNSRSNRVFTFFGAFPQEISDVTFDSTLNDSDVSFCNVLFEYQYYRVQK